MNEIYYEKSNNKIQQHSNSPSTHFFFIRIFFIRITEAQIWSKIIPKTAKNLLAEKKTSPNETVHRKKHFKHSFGGRGRWEIRKKDENFKNILRLKIFYVILIKNKLN